MISVNREAMRTVRLILDEADALGVAVERLDNGATVIDMGLDAKGGWRAAQLYHAGQPGWARHRQLRALRPRRPDAHRGAGDDRPSHRGLRGVADRRLAPAGPRHRARRHPGRAGAGPEPRQPRPLLRVDRLPRRPPRVGGRHPDLRADPGGDGRHDRLVVPGRPRRPVRAVRPPTAAW